MRPFRMDGSKGGGSHASSGSGGWTSEWPEISTVRLASGDGPSPYATGNPGVGTSRAWIPTSLIRRRTSSAHSVMPTFCAEMEGCRRRAHSSSMKRSRCVSMYWKMSFMEIGSGPTGLRAQQGTERSEGLSPDDREPRLADLRVDLLLAPAVPAASPRLIDVAALAPLPLPAIRQHLNGRDPREPSSQIVAELGLVLSDDKQVLPHGRQCRRSGGACQEAWDA